MSVKTNKQRHYTFFSDSRFLDWRGQHCVHNTLRFTWTEFCWLVGEVGTLLASPVWDYIVAMNAVYRIRHPTRAECYFFSW